MGEAAQGEAAQLWGTLSVMDHQRPGAFAAELCLFDVLVVPVPPADGGGRWDTVWDGALQARLLARVPEDLLRRVPWDEAQRGAWARRRVAGDASQDVADIQDERRTYLGTGRTPADYDAEPFHRTRRVLQDFADAARDRSLIAGMPQVPVAVIPAYDGPAAYLQETAAAAGAAAGADREPAQAGILRAFGWEFLAPAGEDGQGRRRSPEDLIGAAVDLAGLPEVREHRDAFRAWTSLAAARGIDPATAQARMEDMLHRYTKAVAATRIPVAVRWGCGIVELAGAVAALWAPAFGLVGPAVKLGQTGAEPRLEAAARIDPGVRPAALVHAARRAFEEVPAAGLRVGGDPPAPIARFWPGTSGALLH